MVILLGKTDDQIYWEGDGTFNGQINVHLLKARVEHKTWDCRGAADRKFCLRLTRALKLAKMVNDSPSQEDLYNLYTETLRLCSLLDPLTIYVDGYYLSVPKAFALS